MKLPLYTPDSRIKLDGQKNPATLPYAQLSSDGRQQLGLYLETDEHIKAAIRGHRPIGGEMLLAATDLRVIMLHDSTLYSDLKLLSYDLINGISIQRGANNVSSVCLFTTLKPYQLDYVNNFTAHRLVKYIESRIYPPETSLMHTKGGMTAMG